MTILNEIIEYKNLCLSVNTMINNDKKVLMTLNNDKRLSVIAEIKSKTHLYLNYRNVILFNKLKIIKNMVLMLFQY